MPNPVVHFEAVGKDGDKLREFYSNAFGWQFQVMPEMDYGVTSRIGGGIGGGVGSSPEGAAATIYVAVPDPQATLDKAVSLGGQVAAPVMEIPNIVTLAQFRDPAGNVIGIVKDDPTQSPPPPIEGANAVAWFEIMGNDGGKLRDFYSQLFGWQFNQPPDMDYGMIDGGDDGIGGGVGGGADKPYAAWYVEVADPAAALQKVESLGGKIVAPATDIGMVVFGQFTDPEGNLVGVFKNNQ